MFMNQFDMLTVEFGTLYNLAQRLGLEPQAVYNWKSRGQIPIKQLKKIKDLSEGRLTTEMLRPDLFAK
jgi:DNA-binding transcriptional regulator YdaS (Cro superfamily)